MSPANAPPRPAPPASHPFRPAWWLPGPHLTAVWGKLFRHPSALDACVEHWDTPDGDILDVVRTPAPEASPVFLLPHGLEGSLRSHYTTGILRVAMEQGWQANLLLFRTCNGERNRAPRSYHSGETTDLDFVVRRLVRERPHAPLLLAGVSLGGNVLLKWLGEHGEALRRKVAAAVAVSTPYDLARSSAHIERGFARLYARNFLRSLKAKAFEKLEQYHGATDRRLRHGSARRQQVIRPRMAWSTRPNRVRIRKPLRRAVLPSPAAHRQVTCPTRKPSWRSS